MKPALSPWNSHSRVSARAACVWSCSDHWKVKQFDVMGVCICFAAEPLPVVLQTDFILS